VLDHVLQLPALLVGECLARGLLLRHPRLEGQLADRISTPVSVSPRFKARAVGSEGVITNRGRPVARLTPVAPTTSETEAEAIRQIESLPWVQPGAGGKVRGLQRGVRLRGEGPNASEIVLQDRD